VENINITEQLNKFKNLINAKSGEVISEQNDPRAIAKTIYNDLFKAAASPGTDENLLISTIQKITSLQLYNAVNGILAQRPISGSYTSIIKLLNGELGAGDVKTITQIKQDLAKIGKNITFKGNQLDIVPNSIKIVGSSTTVPASTDPMTREQLWKTTFICATQQPGAKAYKLKDGTTAYNVGGIFYYNNGRKKLADGTMSNYSCATEFKSNTGTPQKRNRGLAQRFAKSAQSLGIQNGKMNVDTLQKILASLEGPAAKPKTASDFSPQEIPADAFNQQAPVEDVVVPK
jgi:hypothetical protein